MSGLAVAVRDLLFAVEAPAGRQIIAAIDELALAPGQMVALSGPSGSGKSTLLHLLAGLLVPQQGTIVWGDIDLARQSEAARDRWRLAHAGFVFQSFNLIEELSALDNVLLPAWFANIGVGDKRRKAAALLERFGVGRDNHGVALLSRGEQQRVAIARALLLDPKVIFADEPTASLDTASGGFVAETLRTMASEQGKTVIVASHDRAVLDRADNIVSLDHGRGRLEQPAVAA